MLLTALEGGENLELSVSSVNEVDVAGLQVLCAVRRSALARDVRLSISQRAKSASLRQAIAAAGFGSGEDERWLVEGASDA